MNRPETNRPASGRVSDNWKTVAEFIARVGGPDCEVVVHDLSDPVRSVIHVVNGHVTGRAVGQGFRHLVGEMLRNAQGDLLDDWWFRHAGKLVRSLTLLIRDDAGAVIGAVCVNQDVTAAGRTFEAIKTLLPGLGQARITDAACPVIGTAGPSGETAPAADGAGPRPAAVQQSVLDTVLRMIEAIARQSKPAGRTLTRAERLQVVRFMDEREVFLVKGAVEHAAACLGVSKPTIYSDLDALHRPAGQPDKTAPGKNKARPASDRSNFGEEK